MSATVPSNLSPVVVVTEEPTPTPTSADSANSSAEQTPEPSSSQRRGAERTAALLEYFAKPSAEMCELDAAWEEALALYGDEDSDAWVSALEGGTHPLCRVQISNRSA